MRTIETPEMQRHRLEVAVSVLIDDPDAQPLFKQMSAVLHAGLQGIALTGRAAILNPLLNMAQIDEGAYHRILDLVALKRKLRELLPLEGADEEKDTPDRRAYMSSLMANKRGRQRRLVELWNQLRSQNDALRGVARMEFERMHAMRWLDEKNRREEVMRVHVNRRLLASERRKIADKLWEDVDEELEQLAVFVRREMHLPLMQRSVAGFVWKVGTLAKAPALQSVGA